MDTNKLYSHLHNLRSIAINENNDRLQEWENNDNYFLGFQIDENLKKRKAKWRSNPVNNQIMPILEQSHALMCDDRTEAYVKRKAGGDESTKQLLDDIVSNVWENKRVLCTEYKCKKDSLLYGIQIKKVTYDQKRDKNDPLPIFVDRVLPRNFFPDPLAYSINGLRPCRYIFEAVPTSMSDLLEEYPELYDEIAGSGSKDFVDFFDKEGYIVGDPETVVWECYFKDSTMIEEYTSNDNGEKEMKKSSKKYPNGRYVKMVGDIIIEDKPNKYPFFPYVATPYTFDPSVSDKIWGLSLVSPLIDLQDSLNGLEARIFDNITSMVNPIYFTQEGALDLDEIALIPNAILELNGDNASLQVLKGNQLPNEVFMMSGKKEQDIFKQAGINEVTMGGGAQSSRPGTVRQNFNSSITRLRHAIRLANEGLAEVGTMIVKYVQLFVKPNTVVSLSDPDSSVSDLIDETSIPNLKQVLGSSSIQDALQTQDVTLIQDNPTYAEKLQYLVETGMPESEAKKLLKEQNIKQYKNDIREGRYEYVVDVHPVQQADEQAMYELGTQLLQYGMANPSKGQPGIIDVEGFWENFMPKFSGKSKMVRRIMRNQKQMEQQQLMQQQQAQAQIPQGQQQGLPQG